MKPFGPPRAMMRSPVGIEKIVRGGRMMAACVKDGWVIIDHPVNIIPEELERYREGAQEQPTEPPKASPKKRGRPKGSKNTKTKTTK